MHNVMQFILQKSNNYKETTPKNMAWGKMEA
jgi:hypothetical protein